MWWQLYLWTRLRARYPVWSCIRWFIGTLPDRPRDYTVRSTLEPSRVDSRTWAGVIQVGSATAGIRAVVEPPELFRLKCASHRYPADTNSTHFKRNNPWVCRVSARYNHDSTGSKQVYLARKRVYNHSTAHQLFTYRYANTITNLVQTYNKTYTNSV
jgi:hypothetical protein